MLVSTYYVSRAARTKPARRNSVVIWKKERARHHSSFSYAEQTACKQIRGVDYANDRNTDHALPVVRFPGRGGGEVLCLGLQDLQDRKDQPLRERGLRGSRQEGGNRHDRRVRNRRAEIRGPQWRPAFQVHRGRVVPDSLRNAAGDRLFWSELAKGGE